MEADALVVWILAGVGGAIVAVTGAAWKVLQWFGQHASDTMARIFGRDATDTRPAVKGLIPDALDRHFAALEDWSKKLSEQTKIIADQSHEISEQSKGIRMLNETLTPSTELQRQYVHRHRQALEVLFALNQKVAEKLGIENLGELEREFRAALAADERHHE